jgi:tetratricopeptide (TPR) repeat protein
MSILDGIPTEADLMRATERVAPLLDKLMVDAKLSERDASILELMKEGLSLGDIVGITKDQRGALLVQAGRFIQVGDIGKARDVLFKLYQFEPLDERTIYALATTYQLEGNFALAAKLYVFFLALDATNPEGHLRLGECFLAAKEYENAEDSFIIARELAKDAADKACVDYATKMLDVTRAGLGTKAS